MLFEYKTKLDEMKARRFTYYEEIARGSKNNEIYDRIKTVLGLGDYEFVTFTNKSPKGDPIRSETEVRLEQLGIIEMIDINSTITRYGIMDKVFTRPKWVNFSDTFPVEGQHLYTTLDEVRYKLDSCISHSLDLGHIMPEPLLYRQGFMFEHNTINSHPEIYELRRAHMLTVKGMLALQDNPDLFGAFKTYE